MKTKQTLLPNCKICDLNIETLRTFWLGALAHAPKRKDPPPHTPTHILIQAEVQFQSICNADRVFNIFKENMKEAQPEARNIMKYFKTDSSQ